MQTAQELQAFSKGLFFWRAYEPSVKVDLSCCAIRVGEGLLFVDPIPLAEEALQSLCVETPPIGIVLTNGNHERAAAIYRQRFSIPVYAHPGAQPELSFPIDKPLAEGASELPGVQVIELPGAGKGEIALHVDNRVLMLGDALINLEPHGLMPLPAKYCENAREAGRSLRKLLQFPFEVLTFAHGLPIVDGARKRLSELLD